MRWKRTLALVGVCIPFAAASSQAVDIGGIAGAGYAHSSGVSEWAGAGGALFAFGNPGFQAQIDAGDEHILVSHVSGDLLHAGGDVFWRDGKGTFGASVTYYSLSGGTGSWLFNAKASAESYGLFGEWYTTRWLSLRLAGGRYSGDFSGEYGGAGVGLYPLPDLQLTGTFDYVTLHGGGHASVYSGGAEYMPFRSIPVSVAAEYARETGGGSSNTISIVLKYRFGGATGAPLVGWDRRGPVQWNAALPI